MATKSKAKSPNAKKTQALQVRDKAKKKTTGTFADRLSDLLDKSSSKFIMTGYELAKKADVSEGTITGYRNGNSSPNAANVVKIAKAFNVNADYLLGLSDIPKGNANDMAIEARLGLSEKSIANIIKEKERGYSAYVNELISHDDFNNLVHNFWKQVEYSVRRDNELSGSTDEERKKSDTERTNKAERILMEHGLPGHASTIHDWTDLMRYHLSKTTEKIIDDIIEQMIPVRKEELKQHIEDLSKAREQLLSNPELVFINASNILDKEANNGEHNPT